MKPTTKEWLMAAEDDLLAAKNLANEQRLTHVAAFHCQQCIEKSFKAIVEEKELSPLKSHDLIRLQLHANIQFDEADMQMIATINEVYIDSRYPGDMGLLPHGKPTIQEINKLISFCEKVFEQLRSEYQN